MNKLINKGCFNYGGASNSNRLQINKVKIANTVPKTLCLIEPQSKQRNNEPNLNMKIENNNLKPKDLITNQRPLSVRSSRIEINAEIVSKKSMNNSQKFENVVHNKTIKPRQF